MMNSFFLTRRVSIILCEIRCDFSAPFLVLALVFTQFQVVRSQQETDFNAAELLKIKVGFRSSVDLIESIDLSYNIRPLSAKDNMFMRCGYIGKRGSFFFKKEPLSRLPKDQKSLVNRDQTIYFNSNRRVDVTIDTLERVAQIFEPKSICDCLEVLSPWVRAGINITTQPIITWDYFLESRYVASVTKESLDGIEVLKVQTIPMKGFKGKCTVYFVPSANYLVKRYSCEDENENTFGKWLGVTSFNCDEFSEIKPGLFFPKRTQYTQISKFPDGSPDKVFCTTSTEFNSIKVNEAVSEELFDFKIPEGTLVNDFRTNISYRMGPDGMPIGIPSSMSGNSPKARSSWKWVWIIGLFFLIAVPTLLYFKRRSRN